MTVTMERYQNKNDSKTIATISQDKYCPSYNVVIGWTEDNRIYPIFKGTYSSIKSARQAIKRNGTFLKMEV